MIPNQNERVRRGYDELSYAYRSDDTPDDYGFYAEWVALLRELVPEGAPLLDLGCGCGLPGTKLLAESFDVTGVDFSQVQIDRAEQLVPDARFVCADVCEASFAPETFAAIVSFHAIIHMPLERHPGLFEKIALWLRPGGYLLAIVGHEAWTATGGYLGGEMCWSIADEATYLRWIAEAGLHVHWSRFVPDGESGHALILAQKPPVGAEQRPRPPSAIP